MQSLIASGTERVENRLRATDSELLMRFVRHHDEAAFAELVEKHAALVMGVCRRILRHEQDAEDAFQAVFLALARRPWSVRRADSLAGWLLRVAHRTACRAARARNSRRQRERNEELMQTDVSLAAVRDRELEWTLQDELSRLPDKYRAPLSLCYLENKSRRDAAAELECTEASVKARLARGRRLLRNRLMRRGVALSVAMSAAGASTANAAAHVSSVLVQQTVEGCSLYASGAETGAGVSKNAVSLAREEMNAMLLSSIVKSSAAAASLALLVALAVVGVKGNFASAQFDQTKQTTVVAAPADAAEKQPPAKVRAPFKDRQAGEDAKAPTKSFERFLRPSEKKIIEELQQETTLEFIDSPLRDVVDALKDMHRLRILIDQAALDEVGIGADTPITINLRGITLRSGLRWLLRPLELTYTVQDEALLITTPEKAETMRCTRIYPVRELLAQKEDGSFDMDSLTNLISAVVAPESWDVVGGPGAIEAVTFSGVEMLVVSQRYDVQEDVDEFLAHLRSTIDAQRRK